MNVQKSAEEIKIEFASIKQKALVVTVIFILLALPNFIISFAGIKEVFGINYDMSLIPMGIGIFIFSIFVYKYWKCPACNAFPGGASSIKACTKCGAKLK